jgi:type IV pilus assembly protein PilF
MKKTLLMVLLTVLAGCAGQPNSQNGYANNSGDPATRNRARIHTDLGSGYFGQGRIAVALEEFSTAVQIDSGYAPAHNGLGLVYAALREDDKAENSFRRSLQLDPESSESHNNFGTFLCSRNRVDDSIKEFLAALKNPLYNSPESAWLNAGICALKKGDDKSAEGYLKNALQAQPDLIGAHYHLASLYFNRGEQTLANEHMQLFMRNGNPSPEALLLGIRIAREVKDRNAEASYSMLLRNKFPNSEQAKALHTGGE